MTVAAICSTPRVGATALLRCLASVIPGAAEYPDAVASGPTYLTMIHWGQMPVKIDVDRFVYVWRHDRTAQAISWAVAAATGRYHAGQPGNGNAVFDRAAVQIARNSINAQDQAWRHWLAGKQTIRLCYEDHIQRDVTVAARRVLTWLGVAGTPQPPDLHPIDVDTKRAWRAQWEQACMTRRSTT